MGTFTKLFGSLLSLVYHCFDRLVILAYLPLLTRAEHVVYLFRDVNGISPITPEVLRQRTTEYRRWVESFALCHALPIEWAKKGVKKEDQVRPYLQRMERKNQFGVYFIYRSMEVGPTFRSSAPKFPTADPDYRILRRQRSRYTHYYFYIRDEELGPIALCVGSFLPFQINCWLNGHSFMQRQLQRQGIGFRKNDNAFLQADDPKALQEIANRLTASLIERPAPSLDPGSWGRSSRSRNVKASPSSGTFPCSRSSTAETSSSVGTSPSTNCLNVPAICPYGACGGTRSLRSSAFVSIVGCGASCTVCSRGWSTGTTSSVPAAKMLSCVCTRSTPPSCGWRS